VFGPERPQVVSGYVVKAEWKLPLGRTGQLTQFMLRAYNLDDPSLPPVDAVINDTTKTYGTKYSQTVFVILGIYDLISIYNLHVSF